MRQGWQRLKMQGVTSSKRMGSRVSLAIAVAIGVTITGCSSYGSRTEARIACQKWAREGPRFRHEVMATYGEPSKYGQIEETRTRSCRTEEATKQVLGWERIPPQGWDHVYLDERMLGWERVVSKRFRWPSR